MSASLVPVFAATPANTGSGDAVFISIDGGVNFIQISATNNMLYNGQKINFDDVTTTLSPDAVLESSPTTEDPGNFTFEVVTNLADPGQIALAAAYSAKTKLTVAHVYKALPGYTTGPINTFTAWVAENPQPGSDVTKSTKQNISMKVSGKINKTAAVPSN